MEQLTSTANQVGHILKARRQRNKMTQSELAKHLGIGQKRVSDLEARPESLTVDRLLAIANLLDLEILIRDRPENSKSMMEW